MPQAPAFAFCGCSYPARERAMLGYYPSVSVVPSWGASWCPLAALLLPSVGPPGGLPGAVTGRPRGPLACPPGLLYWGTSWGASWGASYAWVSASFILNSAVRALGHSPRAGVSSLLSGRWGGPARDLLPNTSVPFSQAAAPAQPA